MLDGGELRITWEADGRVIMIGPAAECFRGELDPARLAA